MRPTDPPAPAPPGVASEKRDVRASAVLWFAFWLAAAAVVIHIGLYGLFRLFAAETRAQQPAVEPNVAASLRRTPSEPRLEPLPLVPRQALRAAEDARLSSYGWVNQAGGVARIPIDRAMQWIVAHGVPGGKPLPPAAPMPGVPPPAPPAATTPGAAGR